MNDVLIEYADTFNLSATDLGCTDVVVHHIDTGDARPVRQPLRRYPAPHVEVISRQVDEIMDQGVIEPACKGALVPGGGCASKTWSFSSACKNLGAQHPLGAKIWYSE